MWCYFYTVVETVGYEGALEFAGFGVDLRLAIVGGLLTGYSANVHLRRRSKGTFEKASMHVQKG